MFEFQYQFRPPLPIVVGHKDHRDKMLLYETIDDLIRRSGLDDLFVEMALSQRDRLRMEVLAEQHGCNTSEFDDIDLSADDFARQRFIAHSLVAFRCCIVRFLEGNCSVRALSNKLADSQLMQWFCCVENFGIVNPPSKSTVDRYFRWISADDLDKITRHLIQRAGLEPTSDGGQILGLDGELLLADLWVDNTCLKANIHFPVDWVLLCDGMHTLMQATVLIRSKGGLKNRMPQSPEEFLREVNKLAIAMSQQRRKADSKKQRKAILRQMKKLEAKIRNHAVKHQQLLLENWEQTPWSERQAMRIAERIQGIVDQLPEAVEQAHERIIGERQVKSSEKILSLYESEINVIVRGKAGSEVEFGNILAIGEQEDGLIVSWRLYEDNLADSSTVIESVELAQETCSGTIKAVYGDRGTSSAANSKKLEGMGIADCLAPRKIDEFRERMKDVTFADGQKRRAQTEGRLAILKNRFLGNPCRMKGVENRNLALSWAVLSHNLWVVARIRMRQEEEKKRQLEIERRRAA